MRSNKCTQTSFSSEYSTQINLSAITGATIKQLNSDHLYSDFLFIYPTHPSYHSPLPILFLISYSVQVSLTFLIILTFHPTSHQNSFTFLLPIDLTSYNAYNYQYPSPLYLFRNSIPKLRFLLTPLHNKSLLEIIVLTFRLAFICKPKLTMSDKTCDMVFEESAEQQKTYWKVSPHTWLKRDSTSSLTAYTGATVP